jgi:CheY-like chemotaxis protein
MDTVLSPILSLPCSLKFLVVEDHAFQREMLEDVLRNLGAESVYCASNGAEAIRLLKQGIAVDIVITDLMMPDVDGIELLPLLRHTSAGASLVLASSARDLLPSAGAIAKAHGIPLLGAIEKPVTPAKLRPLLEQYAQEHSQARKDS